MAIELVPLCTMRLQAIGAEHAALVYHGPVGVLYSLTGPRRVVAKSPCITAAESAAERTPQGTGDPHDVHDATRLPYLRVRS